MDSHKDYYAILNLSNDALPEEIRRSYRFLARCYHPDINTAPHASQKFREVQDAYKILGNASRRQEYDDGRTQKKLAKTSAFELQAISSHPTLRATQQEQAFYVCLNINAASNLPAIRPPLNLCLVIDHSSSMQGKRLQQIKLAIYHIVEQLRPEDALSLIVFSDRAQVLLPAQTNIDPVRVKKLLETINPGGGTEILRGVTTGLAELRLHWSKNAINHLFLLTDGQTYGDEAGCLREAQWAGNHHINITTIGIGDEWNEDLLDQMATFAKGTSIYIDTSEKIKDVFREAFKDLETIAARKLSLKLHLRSNVKLHRIYQVTPHIARLNNAKESIDLGSLNTNQTKLLLLEFRVRDLKPGQWRMMRFTIEGDIAKQQHYRPHGWVELSTTATEIPQLTTDIPLLVQATLNKISVFKMQEKVISDLAGGQVSAAAHRLQIMATRLLDLGETGLAKVALLEARRLPYTQALSNQGRKAIRYGARALSGFPQEILKPSSASAA